MCFYRFCASLFPPLKPVVFVFQTIKHLQQFSDLLLFKHHQPHLDVKASAVQKVRLEIEYIVTYLINKESGSDIEVPQRMNPAGFWGLSDITKV